MKANLDSVLPGVLTRMLGDELRRVRTRRGWTRVDLQAHLLSDLSVKSLAMYEVGERSCSVPRLVELCQAMGVLAHDLLARAYERSLCMDGAGGMLVDLDRVVNDDQPELLPLRRWASTRLAAGDHGQRDAVPLGKPALASMAELCGVTAAELVGRLHELGGQADETGNSLATR